MEVSTARYLLFTIFVMTIPLPLLGPFDLFAPTVRYLLLTSITGSVAWVEGASGPVPLILALFAGNTLLYLLLNGFLAWAFARSLTQISRTARSWIVVTTCAALLVLSISLDLYRTPFGTLPRSNLLGLLS